MFEEADTAIVEECLKIQKRLCDIPGVLSVGIAGYRIIIKLKNDSTRELLKNFEDIDFDVIIHTIGD